MITDWLRSLMAKDRGKMLAPETLTQMKREIDEEMKAQDRLFDEYLALPDRPKPIELRAAISGAPLQPAETIDFAHWRDWVSKRRAEKFEVK